MSKNDLFAEIRKHYPDKILAYNCSPSFNWTDKFADEEIIKYLNSDLVDLSSSDFSELMDSEDFELNTQNLNENYLEYYIETSFSMEEILIID